MAVRPHPNGKPNNWQIDFYRDGKRWQLLFVGSQAEARLVEADLKRKIHVRPQSPTVYDLFPEWIE